MDLKEMSKNDPYWIKIKQLCELHDYLINSEEFDLTMLEHFIIGLQEDLGKWRTQYPSKQKRPKFGNNFFLQVLKKSNYKCVKCGVDEDLAIDHIIPRNKGGIDDISNYQILCKSCNSSKCDKLEG